MLNICNWVGKSLPHCQGKGHSHRESKLGHTPSQLCKEVSQKASRQMENNRALETGPLKFFGSALPTLGELAPGFQVYKRHGERMEVTQVKSIQKASAILWQVLT